MTEASTPETPTRAARTVFRFRRTLVRAAAAGGILISVLAVAGPSWAGPVSGC